MQQSGAPQEVDDSNDDDASLGKKDAKQRFEQRKTR